MKPRAEHPEGDKLPTHTTPRADARTWIARVLIVAVFCINVSCALAFIAWPGRYIAAYELTGPGAQMAIQGMGVTFLMWNATYPPVIYRPRADRTLFGVVIAQQAIGLVCESALLATILGTAPTLETSIMRFIVFDAGGLIALVVAWALTRQPRQR